MIEKQMLFAYGVTMVIACVAGSGISNLQQGQTFFDGFWTITPFACALAALMVFLASKIKIFKR